jgi:hypothetical protein
MTSIAKQNTIDALYVMHQPEAKKWGVRVIDGNIRIATWTDRLGSFINNFLHPNRTRTDWNKKAKEAISNKLCNEITLAKDSPKKIAIEKKVGELLQNINTNVIIIKQDKSLNLEKNTFLKDRILNLKDEIFREDEFIEITSNNESKVETEKIPFEAAFNKQTNINKEININKITNNIKELWEIKDKEQYGLIVEELNHAKDQDLTKATKVANYTLKLLKNHDLPKDIALNTARKINTAMDEYKIDYDNAFDLIQITGNLVNNGHLDKKLPLKLQLSTTLTIIYFLDKGINEKNAVEIVRTMHEFKIESDKAFELFQISLDLANNGHLDNKLPLKLQLSASLAFIQLTEKKIDRDTALTTVKNRIDKLKKIQNKIPKEMQIDCVHEGKDYEYRVSFSKEQKEKIAESLKTQLKEPLYKKNKVMEEKLKDLSNIHLMNRLDDQSILDGERSSSSFRENGKIISTLNSDPQSNPLKIEEKYESNGFIEVDEEYEIPQNTITNPDSNIRDIPESLLETKFLNPLKNFQIETKLNDKNLTDISHFLSQTTLGTLIGFELEKLKSHVQSTSTKKRGETFYDVDFLTEKTKEGNKRIILKATRYEDGDSLMIDNADPNDPSTTLLPINEFFNYEKDDKVGPEKFRQKMNVDFEIQINQNDEIQIRVIDAGLVNKFSIDYDLLDTTPIDEIFK